MFPFFLVRTSFLPFGSYHAVTLFPFVFYKGEPLEEWEIRHEYVHVCQQLTLLIVPFYLLYSFFWLYGLVRWRSAALAYRAIPFERSAYALQDITRPSFFRAALDWMHRF